MPRIEELKRKAAEHAADAVESGMLLGLGSGSTVSILLEILAGRISSGLLTDIQGIPSSKSTARKAQRLGIPLVSLDDAPQVDLAIDGADEIDPALNLIKGGGGALLREKVIFQASSRIIVIADETKQSLRLGSLKPVPIEVIPFAVRPELQYLASIGGSPKLREVRARRFVTDEGNLIIDCHFGPISDLQHLTSLLCGRAGIVEHGLFLDTAHEAVIGHDKGVLHLRSRQDPGQW